MSRSPELIDRLVNYVSLMSKSFKHVMIKPCKAFKECKSFYADIVYKDDGDIYLSIQCDNINSNYCRNGCFRKNLFSRKLKYEDPDDIIREIVLDALDTLDNITFSIADGYFHLNTEKLPGTEYKEIMNALWSMDEDLECSVCLEKTITETPCGHRLCIPCWSIINETKPRCPICREKIDFCDVDYDESESDSESD